MVGKIGFQWDTISGSNKENTAVCERYLQEGKIVHTPFALQDVHWLQARFLPGIDQASILNLTEQPTKTLYISHDLSEFNMPFLLWIYSPELKNRNRKSFVHDLPSHDRFPWLYEINANQYQYNQQEKIQQNNKTMNKRIGREDNHISNNWRI